VLAALKIPERIEIKIKIQNRSPYFLTISAIVIASGCATKFSAARNTFSSETKSITVATYYYPCEHSVLRWDKNKYPGFTGWDLIRSVPPLFP
jgi:hypothetical protein